MCSHCLNKLLFYVRYFFFTCSLSRSRAAILFCIFYFFLIRFKNSRCLAKLYTTTYMFVHGFDCVPFKHKRKHNKFLPIRKIYLSHMERTHAILSFFISLSTQGYSSFSFFVCCSCRIKTIDCVISSDYNVRAQNYM